MKKWKRTLCVALAVFLCATLAVGCGGKENSAEKDWKKILSGYDSEKTMMIGAWNNPPHSYEAYKIAADMGLTHLFMNNNQMFQPGEKPGEGSGAMEELQTWFGELGLQAIWQVGRWSSDFFEVDWNLLKRLAEYSCVAGVNLWDEPKYSNMDALYSETQTFEQEIGDKIFAFINVWPSSGTASIGATYDKYLERYAEVLGNLKSGRRIFSTDVYPLLDRSGVYSLAGSWLTNMFTLKKLAMENNGEFHMFIQSVGYNGHRLPSNKAEIGFQVWTDLCFGIDGFTYFTYAHNGSSDEWKYTEAIVDTRTGKPHNEEYYLACKAVNEEVQGLMPVYGAFTWKGVLASMGKQTEEIDSGLFALDENTLLSEQVPYLANYSSKYGAVYGVFEDANGNPGISVANYTDPSLEADNVVTLNFTDSNAALVYQEGTWVKERCVNGELELILKSGEGVFVLPVKL